MFLAIEIKWHHSLTATGRFLSALQIVSCSPGKDSVRQGLLCSLSHVQWRGAMIGEVIHQNSLSW